MGRNGNARFFSTYADESLNGILFCVRVLSLSLFPRVKMASGYKIFLRIRSRLNKTILSRYICQGVPLHASSILATCMLAEILDFAAIGRRLVVGRVAVQGIRIPSR